MKPGKSSYVMSLKGINVLVTGGNGAVGCNLVKRLLEQDAKVTVLDDFSQSGTGNLQKHQNLVIVKGDITDKKSLSKIFSKKFDYVFHLAARFANELSVKDPLEDLRVNVQGTLQMLLYASKQQPERFLYTSSSSLYGHQQNSVMKEDLMPNPSTPYATSKLTAEYYCKSIHELYGMDYTIVRLSNSYGPYDPPGRYRNVIPNFFENAMHKKPLTITGTGKETQIHDIAKLILNITGSKSKINHKPMRSFDHVKRRKMDISKAKRMIGYNPSTLIEQGLEKTYEWFLTR